MAMIQVGAAVLSESLSTIFLSRLLRGQLVKAILNLIRDR